LLWMYERCCRPTTLFLTRLVLHIEALRLEGGHGSIASKR
jgi:hypothetical protein